MIPWLIDCIALSGVDVDDKVVDGRMYFHMSVTLLGKFYWQNRPRIFNQIPDPYFSASWGADEELFEVETKNWTSEGKKELATEEVGVIFESWLDVVNKLKTIFSFLFPGEVFLAPVSYLVEWN